VVYSLVFLRNVSVFSIPILVYIISGRLSTAPFISSRSLALACATPDLCYSQKSIYTRRSKVNRHRLEDLSMAHQFQPRPPRASFAQWRRFIDICCWVCQDCLLQTRIEVVEFRAGFSYRSFACAIYRRNNPHIRLSTTLIGLIDVSVSNRVAVNWEG
jgi:hypothetical protein